MDPELMALLQELGVIPQQDQGFNMRDIWMQQLANPMVSDPVGQYMNMGGTAVDPRYAVDDMLAWMKEGRDTQADAMSGLYGMQQDQQQFGLDQEQFAYQQQRDQQQDLMEYGDPGAVSRFLGSQLGPEALAGGWGGDQEAMDSIARTLGWVDQNTGEVKMGPQEVTLLDMAMKQYDQEQMASQEMQAPTTGPVHTTQRLASLPEDVLWKQLYAQLKNPGNYQVYDEFGSGVGQSGTGDPDWQRKELARRSTRGPVPLRPPKPKAGYKDMRSLEDRAGPRKAYVGPYADKPKAKGEGVGFARQPSSYEKPKSKSKARGGVGFARQ